MPRHEKWHIIQKPVNAEYQAWPHNYLSQVWSNWGMTLIMYTRIYFQKYDATCLLLSVLGIQLLCNKSTKWHCGRHTPIKKHSKPWYMNDFWVVVSKKKIEELEKMHKITHTCTCYITNQNLISIFRWK